MGTCWSLLGLVEQSVRICLVGVYQAPLVIRVSLVDGVAGYIERYATEASRGDFNDQEDR
jgi:hypothetical protein